MSAEASLYERVAEILEQARAGVARSINTAMVQTYWLIGREIVEVEQAGERRAGYGDEVLERLSARLGARFGRGWSVTNLRRFRKFFLVFPEGSGIRPSPMTESGRTRARFPPDLSWTHYQVLMRIEKPTARSFYELEAARGSWSVRELERQVGALVFERLGKESPTIAADAAVSPRDVIKDPFVLEFLGLRDVPALRERDLEQAIIDRLEEFLRELGKGFCFVARQQRITLDGDHFFIDLVFYNRLLRCFVLVDLKLGKLTHQDLGQMQMYVNYFDRTQREPHEARTIGIVLCSEKNDAMVRITLPEDGAQIVAARYQLYLPTEDELRVALTRERHEAERLLRLAASA